ncbi:diaminopimelate epimerase [Granulicella aggregans]|uniref:Diaminopimelate epimerase n=1 Tax=Granulicella aggregans TaxID=474949 RepID=A0A7W8E275_9BACT|nr:diaminopimelate epimerase [Granulicella aggregans]MBB5055894.1 diaminopimelate epimerase [Granulicella aggregans]
MDFVKAHACGNDFLILEEAVAQRRHAELAKKLCSRNTSIGADGIEFLERRAGGEFFLRLFNADGSEAELSGNGTRCVAAWLAQSEGLTQVTLGTHAGKRACTVIEASDPVYTIESEMGVPRVMARAIDLPGVGIVEGAMVNVGNPHFVLFVHTDDFSAHGMSWQELGAKISTDPMFAHGTNVEFVKVLSKSEIEFRIFERGCGPTTSSGTGTCASSSAAMVLRGVDRELTAIAQGGAQRTVWPSNQEVMRLTGPAEIICAGKVAGL